MSAGRNDDDKTDPEGMETILVEHENGHANGNGVPGDPEAQRILISRILETDANQSRELLQHETDIAYIRRRVDAIEQGVKQLAKMLSIRNAIQSLAPRLHMAMSGVIAGAIVGVVAWFALRH